MDINDRIQLLREKMLENKIDAYLIPTCDYHGSEYIDDYFKAREYISGFTGSAGTALVTMEEAFLWTDGRYFLQAQEQLQKSEFELMKSGEENIPSIYEFIEKSNIASVGFDGRCISYNMARRIEKIEGLKVISDIDFVGAIWEDRPNISAEPIWIYEEKYAGESVTSKLQRVREEMKQNHCDILVLTALDEIAWMTNLRGNDIDYSPVFFAFMIMTQQESSILVQSRVLSKDVRKYLDNHDIQIIEYENVYEEVKKVKNLTVWLNSENCNYNIYKILKENNNICDRYTPALLFKAVKNPTEIEGMKRAHLLDGIAMTKFIYWLKNEVVKNDLNEVIVGEKLEEFRSRAESYIEPSFEPIVGYNDHGAIVHYSATDDSSYTMKPEGIVLIDSGGHYYEGTTDITRTVSLGKVTDKMKRMYTLVLKGHLSLAAAVFKSGCSGVALDYIARQPLWHGGMDFNHGTGHGVGCLLNVHEGPNAFRYRIIGDSGQNPPFSKGMITSNEPGIYLEGEFGIRIENLILCVSKNVTQYGEFLGFEDLTLVPYDKELIDYTIMTERERELLGSYNQKVYNELKIYLDDNERKWLKNYL